VAGDYRRHPNEVGSDAEFFHSYAHRGAIPASLWQSLLDRAINSTDVLIFSAYYFPTTIQISLTRRIRNRTILTLVGGQLLNEAALFSLKPGQHWLRLEAGAPTAHTSSF
jgi:hypothetical protein